MFARHLFTRALRAVRSLRVSARERDRTILVVQSSHSTANRLGSSRDPTDVSIQASICCGNCRDSAEIDRSPLPLGRFALRPVGLGQRADRRGEAGPLLTRFLLDAPPGALMSGAHDSFRRDLTGSG